MVVGSEACVVGGGGGHPAVSLFLRDRALFDRGDLVQVGRPNTKLYYLLYNYMQYINRFDRGTAPWCRWVGLWLHYII